MEFDNIKSSAALIYDEFIQNAGKSLPIQTHQAFYVALWPVLT